MAKRLRWLWIGLLLLFLLGFILVQLRFSSLNLISSSNCFLTTTTYKPVDIQNSIVGPDTSQRCHDLLKPIERRHGNSTWTLFTLRQGLDVKKDVVTEFYVLSAFYDERTVKRDVPCVRLLLTSSGLPQSDTLFCQIWYDGVSRPYISKAEVIPLGDEPGQFKTFMIVCDVFSTRLKPDLVSVVVGRCRNASNAVTVVSPLHTRWQHEFGVCAVEGTLRVGRERWLVEWMELLQLLGVGHVTAYDVTIPHKAGLVLDNYVMSGKSDVIHVKPSYDVRSHINNTDNKNQSLYFDNYSIIINDCILRNMYLYKHIIVGDFGEIILPVLAKTHVSYSQMFSHLGAEMAAMLLFDRGLVKSGKSPRKIADRKEITSTIVTNLPEITTFMINPDMCLYLKGVACVTDQRIFQNTNLNVKVHTSAASVHVFKDCSLLDNPQCKTVEYTDKETTKFVLNDRERLAERIKRRHEMIRLEYNW